MLTRIGGYTWGGGRECDGGDRAANGEGDGADGTAFAHWETGGGCMGVVNVKKERLLHPPGARGMCG